MCKYLQKNTLPESFLQYHVVMFKKKDIFVTENVYCDA